MKYLPGCVSFRLVVIIIITVITFGAEGQAKRRTIVPGQRAVIFDERFSALRTRPDVKAPLKQRLRRGRVVGILGSARKRSGEQFLKVAISRNTQGWVLTDAVSRRGNPADAEKLMRLIEETNDDFTKTRLARLCADEFRATRFAPRALLILGDAAEHAAERLTRDAKRRAANGEISEGPMRRNYLLSYAGLDRYNRIGVTFDYEGFSDRIVYDGSAYREILRRYPRSAESQIAREKLSRN